jgi:hypothetical protein
LAPFVNSGGGFVRAGGGFARAGGGFAFPPASGGAAPAPIDGLIVFAGQSNGGVGQGVGNNLDNAIYGGIGQLVNTTIPSDSRIQLAKHYALAVADPLTWNDVPSVGTFRDLQQYSATNGAASFGPELAFGRYMADCSAMTLPIHVGGFGVNGCDIGRYLPGSNFPVGNELFTQLTTHINLLQTNSGKQLAVFIWDQGESDADTDAESAAYGGKLATFEAALRAIYGAGFLFVIRRLSNNQITGFTSTMTTARVNAVQAAQDAFAAAHPTNCIVVNTDRDVTIGTTPGTGQEHFRADGYWQVGNDLAAAVLPRVKPGQSDSQGSGAIPYLQWCRAPSNGNDSSNGNVTIYSQTSAPSGDLELLFAMHASSTSQTTLPALTTANGYASTGHATAQSIFGGSTVVSLAAFSRAATGGTPLDAVLTDAVTRKRGWTLSVRNTSGIGAQNITADNLNNATHTLNGITTTVDNARVFFVVAYFSGSPCPVTVFTAGGLTNVTIHRNTFRNHNGSSSQDACKFAVLSGTKATIGATGTATFTTGAVASVAAAWCGELKPP